MRGGDDAGAAVQQAATFRDGRVTEAWDPGREAGAVFAGRLQLRETAWDVYLVYGQGVRWEGSEPPAPTFWMHQLREEAGADPKLCLDPGRLTREVLDLLGKRE